MTTFDDAVRRVRDGSVSADAAADELIAALTDRELLWLLDGDLPVRAAVRLPSRIKAGPVTAGAVTGLGIPGVRSFH